MPDSPITIKRYPNRRYYASNTSSYISLQDIEALVQQGHTVEIRDSQTGDDLTRTVLTQIIIERHPEKMSLFPIDMLHCILRSNDVMSGFLRDYFRHSLTYLNYLQRHSTSASSLVQPMHWVKTWLDGLASIGPGESERTPETEPAPLSARVEQLEERLRRLESKEP
jgi:polyhydroxyalkanoate synthesis repressor PhaR